MDISNGEGIGVSLFVQGCSFHCKNCFNTETWDFNGGKAWTEDIEKQFLQLINKPYITRISFLGGEPLHTMNLISILHIINHIKMLSLNTDRKIWLYTGYTWEEIMNPVITDDLKSVIETETRKYIVLNCDILVDGRFIDSQKDISLKWCGSKNQRVIDIKKSITRNEIVLYKNS